MKVLSLVLAFRTPPTSTVKSLLRQSIPADIIVIAAYPEALRGLPCKKIKCYVVEPKLDLCVGKRVSDAINRILGKVDLDEYDYLLKIDDDVILPRDFLEKNLINRRQYEIIGRGYSMIIKIETFLRLFGGKWPYLCVDDTFIILKCLANNRKILPFSYLKDPLSIRSIRMNKKRHSK